jgi:sucrose-phosphate synthase
MRKHPIVLPNGSGSGKNRLLTADRVLISDIDNTLIGDAEALQNLMHHLHRIDPPIGFGVATGRHLESTLEILQKWQIPLPDILITSVGSEIHYGPKVELDTRWRQHIDYRWQPEALRQAMQEIDGIELQAEENQRSHKISYLIDPILAPKLREILRHLRRKQLHFKAIYSHECYLDLLPLHASKGDALRYFALKWGIPINRLLVAGDSGNDEAMLKGNTLAVVVGNHSPELEKLRGRTQVYFAKGHYAWGILEALEYYNFLGH